MELCWRPSRIARRYWGDLKSPPEPPHDLLHLHAHAGRDSAQHPAPPPISHMDLLLWVFILYLLFGNLWLIFGFWS